MAHHRPARPYWSQVLRALREARGITQDGWAMQIGYGRATVKRWEAGETVPSADAEAKIISLCHERALFRPFKEGPLAGVRVTPDWLSDLLASARLEHASSQPHSTAQSTSYANTTTQYALSNDVAIAYQVFGAGPIDLVVTPGLVSHRELEWEHQRFAELLNRFASVGRVAIFDKRGTGMSDRVAPGRWKSAWTISGPLWMRPACNAPCWLVSRKVGHFRSSSPQPIPNARRRSFFMGPSPANGTRNSIHSANPSRQLRTASGRSAEAGVRTRPDFSRCLRRASPMTRLSRNGGRGIVGSVLAPARQPH
jgi:transcriptional regulator with XRE-family HTH domain